MPIVAMGGAFPARTYCKYGRGPRRGRRKHGWVPRPYFSPYRREGKQVGWRETCRLCALGWRKGWRRKHRATILKRERQDRDRRPDVHRDKSGRYYERNREKCLARSAEGYHRRRTTRPGYHEASMARLMAWKAVAEQ